jgi:hypothetical protein
MPLLPVLSSLLSRASRALGLESVDAFPPGHRYPYTRWDRAYFDIASDLTADRMETAICEAIMNTPMVFAHITHPTPRMQRALLSIIHARLRRGGTAPTDLVAMLIDACDSPRTPEALPGLRAALASTDGYDPSMRIAHLQAWLADMPVAFDVIEAPVRVRG